METAISYQFPVSQSFEIKEVLDLNFNILPHPEAWVDLNRLRKEDYLNDLYYHINYKQGRGPERIPQLFKKIIFTGHRGCGKTFELYRLVQELHQPRRFFCIYIDCETELPLGEFEWQDFFVLMVRKLAEKAAAYPSLAHAELQEIAKEWQVNTEIHETIGKTYHDVLTGDGHLFQEFQQDPARFKMAYSRNTETAAHIRRVVKSNPYALAKKMSAIIATLRQELRDREEYDDILFVFDGTEKVGFDKYRDLFIDNYAAVSAIDAHLISAIPIATCYMLEHSAQQKLYERIDLPMFRLDTPEARAIFAQIITKRVEKEAFIELDALDLIVKKSGGCARQLLDIAINAYKKARGNKITLAYLQHALEELGRHMNDHISEAESAILQDVKKGIFHRPNSPVVTRLINELSLLKYDDGSYAVNPLLEDFL